jgi:hypothetical protein
MEERLSAVLSGDDRVSGDIAQIAEELGDLADDAIDSALGLERTEDAADDLARSSETSDEIDEVSASAGVATASVAGLDAALSGLETDIDLDVDAADFDALTLDAEDLSTAVAAVPAEARLARSALAALAEENLRLDADIDMETATIGRQVTLSVDRSDLARALGSLPDAEVDAHPVLRDLQGSLDDFDAGEATARTAVTAETTDFDAPYSAALSAVQALEERVDELDATIVSATRAAADLPDRVSVDIQGDVEDILAALRTTEARVRSLDGRTISIDVDREDLELPDADEFDLRAAVDASAAHADLAALRSDFLSLPDEENVSIDSDADLRGITAMATALASLPNDETARIDTEADMDLRGTDVYESTLNDIRSESTEIDVGFDVDAADTRRSALGLGAVSIPVDLDLRQRVDDVIDRLDLSAITTQIDAVEREASIDISMGRSEQRVLNEIGSIEGALRGLLDDRTVSIHTEAELDALVRSIDTYEDLPREVRSELEATAHTADAQTALTAVLGTAETIDDLDPTVDVDTDTDALRTLRGLSGDGLDFDVPDLDMPDLGDRDDRSGLDEAFGGATSVVAGGLRGAPGVGGIARALSGAGPAAMLGGAGVLGALTSAVAGAVSAGVGAGIGAAAIGGGLALPVALNIDDGEIDALKESVKAALAPLEGGEWEDFQQRLFDGVPQAAGMAAQAVNSVQDTLLDTADRVGDSFWAEFPAILEETTDSVQMLAADISGAAIGALESVPGIIRESSRAADELLPEFGDVAAPALDIAGSVSRLGTGTLDLGINALLEPALDTLAALAPLADLFGDALHVAGEAAAFVYDHLGSENVDAFAGAIQTAVDVVYALGTGLYDVGDAFGVWDTLASIIRSVGDGLGFVYNAASDAYDALAGGAEWVLSKIVELHNVINNVPGAAEMSAFISASDISMPDLFGGPGGSGSGGDSDEFGGSGFAPSPAPTASVMDAAVASLPSTSPGGSAQASSASASASPSSATPSTPSGTTAGRGSTTSITNNYDVTINAAGTKITKTRVQRWIRRTHNRLERRQAKQSTAGAG